MERTKAVQNLVDELKVLMSVFQNEEMHEHDLRPILKFINKIISRTFKDVLGVLWDLKLMTEYDVRSRLLISLAHDLEILRNAARHNNQSFDQVEYLSLEDLYQKHVLPFAEQLKFNHELWPLPNWLIESKIQRTNMMIEKSLAEMDNALNELRQGHISLEHLQEIAQKKYIMISGAQAEFFELNNRLMGFA